ncbi:peptidoglycan-associated lipoprotein [Solimonas aquatica]|uniref:Peptidoglycan-associated lipoprotein n=1 Tax=Solimonas aquatica TaxID=489703 RepID=A0A1H9HH31_9GAMM|nr:peptidoglycan-associated lipoprotein Pal [Solimonas aquatica]SEQ61607.1 peptidoglycan-associated lipoprotein [Solimonas aquatica]
MKRNKFLLAVGVLTALLLGACSHGKHDSSAPVPVNTNTSGYADTTGGANQLGNAAEDARTAAERALTNNIVYFDYDSSVIKEEYKSVVSAYARYLSANPAAKVRLEGHTDERGSREYNIGLGERRANAVRDALTAAGVTPAQIAVISYGKERPAVEGHDEAAWSQNRRVQIIRL